MLNFMQINEKNIEKPLCKNIDISELPELMQFLAKNQEKKGGWDRVRLVPKFLSESTQYFLHHKLNNILFSLKYNYF